MATATSTILVRVIGSTSNLRRSMDRARKSLGGLEQVSRSITGALTVATVGVALFGAAAVGAGAAGAAALAGVAGGLLGIGILAAAQSKRVKSAFKGLAGFVKQEFADTGKPLIEPLVHLAGQLKQAFLAVKPALTAISSLGAELVRYFADRLVPIARQLGPILITAFKAGKPVLKAFIDGLTPILEGLQQFFAILGKQSGAFAQFVTVLMQGIGRMLPALAQLLAALAPIGTAILQLVLPALTQMFTWIAERVGPAFQRVTGFLKQHATAAKVLGGVLIGLVAAVKLMRIAIGLASAAMLLWQGVMVAVRGAILLVRGAMIVLNVVMAANPILLVVAALAALVAAFVIAWKHSETFRKIVKGVWHTVRDFVLGAAHAVQSAVVGAWRTIRDRTLSLFGTVRDRTLGIWRRVRGFVMGAAHRVRDAVVGAWNTVRSRTVGAWNAVVGTVRRVWGTIVSTVRNLVGSVVSTVSSIKDRVIGAVAGAGRWLYSAGADVIHGLIDGVKAFVSLILGIGRTIKQWTVDALWNAANWLYSVGKDIIWGLIDGVKAMAGRVIGAVRDVISGAIGWAKSFLGIGSPSKLFAQYGEWVSEGLAIGMSRKAGLARRAAGGLARQVADGFSAPKLTLDADAELRGQHGHTPPVQLTVNAPVGSNAADIGRELQRFLDEYYRRGGKARTA